MPSNTLVSLLVVALVLISVKVTAGKVRHPAHAGRHAEQVDTTSQIASLLVRLLHSLDAVLTVEVIHCLLTAAAVFGFASEGGH
jgi:hypothetical protein